MARKGHSRYRKSVEIIPGVKLSVNKLSAGITLSVAGVTVTANTLGERTTTVSAPVKGLYWTERQKGRR